MQKLYSLMTVICLAVLLSCSGGSPESAEDKGAYEFPPELEDEIFGEPETARPESDPYEIPKVEASSVVKYESLGLDALDDHHEIVTRLQQLHIPVNHYLTQSGMGTRIIENGTVLNTSLVFTIDEEADVNKLKEYYSRVLTRLATEQGWTQAEDLVVRDDKGINKLIVSASENGSRMMFDFFDPAQ